MGEQAVTSLGTTVRFVVKVGTLRNDPVKAGVHALRVAYPEFMQLDAMYSKRAVLHPQGGSSVRTVPVMASDRARCP